MTRFLIELPHSPDGVACAKFVKLALTSGSHFLTHADWGCNDGVHSGWFIMDAESKDEAKTVLPPPLRPGAKITALNHFTVQEMDAIIGTHSK
jgi:hypothetical protein